MERIEAYAGMTPPLCMGGEPYWGVLKAGTGPFVDPATFQFYQRKWSMATFRFADVPVDVREGTELSHIAVNDKGEPYLGTFRLEAYGLAKLT